MLTTRFVRFFPPPRLGHTEKTFARVGGGGFLACHRNRLQRDVISVSSRASSLPLALFEGQIPSETLAVQLSQVAPDGLRVLIRDF